MGRYFGSPYIIVVMKDVNSVDTLISSYLPGQNYAVTHIHIWLAILHEMRSKMDDIFPA